MHWSTNPPTDVGWYWFRKNEMSPSTMTVKLTGRRPDLGIVFVSRWKAYEGQPLHVRSPLGFWLITDMGGDWAGPIPEPEE